MEDLHDARETPLDIMAATKVIDLLISAGIDPDDANLTSTQILDIWALVSVAALRPHAQTEGA